MLNSDMGTTSTGPKAPQILASGTDVSQITPGQAVTFTALVTDPSGLDNLVGGELTSVDGLIHYGPFSANGERGAYSLTVSFAEVANTKDLTFPIPGQQSFKATFYDLSGQSVSTMFTVNFTCAQASPSYTAICHGTCKDLQNDSSNCGACDKVTPAGYFCGKGKFTEQKTSTTRQSCTATCGAEACVANVCSSQLMGGTYRDAFGYNNPIDCTTTPPQISAMGYNFNSITCCCQ